jgi:hypothetical protein
MRAKAVAIEPTRRCGLHAIGLDSRAKAVDIESTHRCGNHAIGLGEWPKARAFVELARAGG